MTRTFSHTSDFPPCREQLWDKPISHGFHDLQLCTVYLTSLKFLNVQSMRENAFCMGFHVRWTSHRSSQNPTLVASDSGGIRRLVVRKIHLTWKTIQHAYLVDNYRLIPATNMYHAYMYLTWRPLELKTRHQNNSSVTWLEESENVKHDHNWSWLQIMVFLLEVFFVGHHTGVSYQVHADNSPYMYNIDQGLLLLLLLLPINVQTNIRVVFRTGASVWWMCPCTISAVSEERCWDYLQYIHQVSYSSWRPSRLRRKASRDGATVELDGNWFHRLAASGKKENFMVLVRQ